LTYDLSGTQADGDVCDGDVFGLAGAVGDHDAPACGEGVLGRLNCFRDGANLVDLEQQRVCSLGIDCLLDEFRVCDGQVITGMLSTADANFRSTYATIWFSAVL
jgi:hypothetical protein